MAKVLVKRVPKKTNLNQKRQVISEWNNVILSKRINELNIRILSANILFEAEKQRNQKNNLGFSLDKLN